MTILLQQAVNGLMIGSVYALIASGFTLVFGVARILNLAHWDIVMAGAYAGMLSLKALPDNIPAAIVIAVAVGIALGFLVEFLVLRPTRRGLFLTPVIASIGASQVLENSAAHVFGNRQLAFAPNLHTGLLSVGPLRMPSIQSAMFVVAIALTLALTYLVNRTAVGRRVRATAEDPEVAVLMGTDVNQVILITVLLGSALAGAAGVAIGLAYDSVSPFMGIDLGIQGLVAMVVGGAGSISGAVVTGLMLGVLQGLTVGFLPSTFRDAIAFGLVLVILVVRPRGLFAVKLGRRF